MADHFYGRWMCTNVAAVNQLPHQELLSLIIRYAVLTADRPITLLISYSFYHIPMLFYNTFSLVERIVQSSMKNLK